MNNLQKQESFEPRPKPTPTGSSLFALNHGQVVFFRGVVVLQQGLLLTLVEEL